ncbi:MAG: hypothetical protein RBR44_01080 [Bacilli bacterium]|jgi:hypothetical protein|nr:hypothetical protein [Bacilli bacterium]
MTVLFLSLRLNSGEKSFFHLKQANRDLVITSHNVHYVNHIVTYLDSIVVFIILDIVNYYYCVYLPASFPQVAYYN